MSNIYDEYQNGITILKNIPNFKPIDDVPLDYLHLICLGVMKKLINLWLCGPLPVRILFKFVKIISYRLVKIQNFTPNDFARKPRSLNEYRYWKGTEYRNFLLYTGPVVLKGILKPNVYENFLVLHVAISILCNTNYVKNDNDIEYADKLLRLFVSQFQIIYGKEYVSHNIHNLLHITSDVKKFGSLDEYSAFRFENFNASIKKIMRKFDKPLQQLAKRYSEIENNTNETFKLNTKHVCSKPHTNGPLIDYFSKDESSILQFKCFSFNKLSITSECLKNGSCILNNDTVVFVQNIVSKSNEIFILYNKLTYNQSRSNFYTSPCSSTNITIQKVSETVANNSLFACNILNIKAKVWRIPLKNEFIAFPIIHTYNIKV